MPEISRFFGMQVYMKFYDHEPPHVHVRYGGLWAKVDLNGNVLKGSLDSPARLRLLRYWLELHHLQLEVNWQKACSNIPLEKVPPLT
jgi:hypothetical protein